jgi:CubicO group peptidase (beta-lactamase class C family)
LWDHPRVQTQRSCIVTAALASVVYLGACRGRDETPVAPVPSAPPGLAPELDAFVARTLSEWELPGMAIAIVKDGQVVAVNGYGVRELGKRERVDADTIFDAASLTKSFTAAAVGTLVDEKRMAWDDPIRRFLPTLEFADPYLTANVTLRDLLCHRTAIRATNSAWYLTHLTRPELLGLVKHMVPAAPFRTKSVYWNIGYTIVGEAAAAVAGQSWEDLVTARLLLPLGLARTTAYFDRAPAMGNLASPHAMIDGVQRAIPRETARASTAPAGAIQTSANDLATWMLFQLGDGTVRGKRVLGADTLAEMHAPQILFSTSPEFREQRRIRFFAAYGFGWQVFDYRGSPFIWHTGGGDGQAASMALFPELHLGIAVLVNSSKVGSGLNLMVITSRIADHYLHVASGDDNAEARASFARKLKRAGDEAKAVMLSRKPDTRPTRPLSDYTGTYRDRLPLDVVVTLAGDALHLRYGGGEDAILEHWYDDAFRVHWSNAWHDADLATFVTFKLDPSGRVTELHMDPFGDPVDATRIGDH